MTNTEPAAVAERARALLALGRAADAETVIRAGLAADPGDGQLLHLLASCLHELGDVPAALGAALAAVAALPEDVEALSTLAAVQVAAGRRADALRTVGRAVQLAPFFGDLHRQHAQVLQANGKRDAALTAARQARRLAPDDAGVAAALAELLLASGALPEARDEVDRALQLDPQDPEAHRLRGLLSLHERDSAASIRGYREALRLDPNDAVARAGLTTALKSRNPVFRAVLGFSFWLQSCPPSVRAAIGVAPFVALRVLIALGNGPVFVALTVLLIGWLAIVFGIHPFMNVVMLASAEDRPLMTPREKGDAAVFLLFAAPALVAAGLSVATDSDAAFLALALGLCTVFGPAVALQRRRWQRVAGLVVLALGWVLAVHAVVWTALGQQADLGLAAIAVFFALMLSSIVCWLR